MLTIQYKKIKELIPYINNSRTHSDAQIAQIASSIKEFGWTNPILLDGENGIIAGHGRLLAGQLLGEEKVPTIELKHLTENQKKAYIIADNKLALNSGWNEELLTLELESLKDVMDLDIIGFNADELNLLFNGWQSDIDRMDKIDALDSEVREKIVIKCNNQEKVLLLEKIENLIDDLGLHDVEIG